MSTQRISPLAALFVAILAMSWGAILVRWSDAPTTVAAFYRVLFTGLPLIPLAVWRYRDDLREISLRDIGFASAAGIALALHFATWFESLSWTSVAASVTIVQAQPLFVAIGAWLLLHERLSRRMTLGIGIAVVGMVAMSLGDFIGGTLVGPRPMYGNGLALVAAVMMAGYVLTGRSLRQRIAVIPYVVVVYAVCTLVLAGIVAVQGHGFGGYPTREWLIFIGLAIGPGLIGHTVINWVLGYLESSVVSVSILGEPIGAALLAVLLLSEIPTPYTVLGGLIVLSGIYLTATDASHPRTE